MHNAFADELKKIVPAGEEIRFVRQRPFPDPTAWSNAARKLIIGEVDLIVAYGYPAANTILSRKSEIPVVYVGVFDPDAAIQGGNVTGCGYRISLSSLLRYYKQIMNIERVVIVYSRNEADSVKQMKTLTELADQQQMQTLKMDISAPEDIGKFSQLAKKDGVYITGSTFAHVMIDDIKAVLEKKKIPSADIFPNPSDEGILMVLYQDPEKMGRRAAELAGKVIAGEKAGSIAPVLMGDDELVFNLIEAQKLGIDIPAQLIGEATRVIK